MNFVVEDSFHFMKEYLSKHLVSQDVYLLDGEDTAIYHQHGLAGFYGPKIVLRKNDYQINFSFKLFSLLENKLEIKYDYKRDSFHFLAKNDISLSHDTFILNITNREIENILGVYIEFFKEILKNKDQISSLLLREASALEGEVIFNKLYIFNSFENREHRIGIKDNNVYIDDIFNEGYIPIQSHFEEVFMYIYEKYLNSYPFDNIKWYILKKENQNLKITQVLPKWKFVDIYSFDKHQLREILFSEKLKKEVSG